MALAITAKDTDWTLQERTVKLDARNSVGNRREVLLSMWEKRKMTKGTVNQKWLPDEPWPLFGRLESGGGVGTLPPDIRFRNLLKSAT